MMEERPNEPLYWGVPLPGDLDATRIIVDDSFRSKLRVAGFSHMAVYPAGSQPTGYSAPETDSPALYSVQTSPEDQHRRSDRRWPALNVLLDIDKLALTRGGAKNERPEEVLARGIDIALRNCVRAGARDHLFGKDGDKIARAIRGVLAGAYVGYGVTLALAIIRPEVGLACVAAVAAEDLVLRAATAIRNKRQTGSFEWKRMRWDLVGADGVSPDRYVVARGLAGIPGLVYVQK